MGFFSRKQSVAPPPVPEPESVEYAVMPKELRAAVASLKGRAPVPDASVVKIPVEEAFPVSAVIVREERIKEAAQKKAEEDAKKNLRPGYKAGDRGIFICTVEPKDRNGKSLGVKLNVFGLPKDYVFSGSEQCQTFKKAAEEVGNIKGLFGHDGLKLDPEHYEEGFIAAIKDGSAFGKWIIPFREWVDGKDRDGKIVQEKNNLYALQNEGDFKKTFTTERGGSSNYPHYYWSCTEHRVPSTYVWLVRFSDGDDGWSLKGYGRLSCRPCRVELAL